MLDDAFRLLLLFGGLAVLISLLNYLSAGIEALAGDQSSNADHNPSPSTNQTEHRHPVAAAIGAYQEKREADDQRRAEREMITIKVLTATGGFALLAAGATVYSAIILTRQASDFRDQEQRQLRAYVFPDGDIRISNANIDIGKEETEAPTITLFLKNTGVTPAYDLTNLVGAAIMPYPNRFKVTDLPTFIRSSPSLAILAHDVRQQIKVNVGGADKPLTVAQKVSLNNSESAIYFFGEATYRDAFNVVRCTRFKFVVGGSAGFNGEFMGIAPEGNEADTNCREPKDIPQSIEVILPAIPHYQF